MADSNFDRSNTIRLLREQTSRVYMQTIAANEREDRILHKKLDAIDLEHRAQFLKMKKCMRDEEVKSRKRLSRLKSNLTHSNGFTSPDKTKQRKDRPQKERILKREGSNVLMLHPLQLGLNKNETHHDKNGEHNVQIKGLRRRSKALLHRVKYTESEVAHLKASFAGQRTHTPTRLRRRTFLPHLQEAKADRLESAMRRRRARKKEKERGKQTLEARLSDLTLEGTKLGDEKLPNVNLDRNKLVTEN